MWHIAVRLYSLSLLSFAKSSALSLRLRLPAECLLHQLPAAAPRRPEPHHRRRRQQVSGGRQQQAAATGVQLRLNQAHEAYLDLCTGTAQQMRMELNLTAAMPSEVPPAPAVRMFCTFHLLRSLMHLLILLVC